MRSFEQRAHDELAALGIASLVPAGVRRLLLDMAVELDRLRRQSPPPASRHPLEPPAL